MNRTILVVDDNVYLARTTAQVLEAQGFQAHAAMNATQALKLVASQAFEGAIIDVDLKGRVNGVELLAAIRELRPGLRAVLTTGHEPDIVEPPEGVVLLRKPYRMSDLVAAMFKEDRAA
ncbi:response regulator [Lysobacter arvi]|uniref:Response regulator n=1 Tax=Lysobacter arvi TaxID=3038776 RepID=A0ABU1CH16_9GAMM|nr:response regulator [Lysobacter arvi]MDR0184229.1 response regulator [Lysobacter arvi]